MLQWRVVRSSMCALTGRIIFVTGTSTGVGKTVATGILLHELRKAGIRAMALKPFCTGSRRDARHLRRLQRNELTLEEINPFFYRQPVTPYVAARGRSPSLRQVVQHICGVRERCDVLLVEGAGGLLAPLGKSYSAAEIIGTLECSVLVVGANKLGTLNHTLLTVKALPSWRAAILLMDQRHPDLSAKTNARVLRHLLEPLKVFELEHFGTNPLSLTALNINGRALKKIVSDVLSAVGQAPRTL
jgi:dethiobiotin synthetase